MRNFNLDGLSLQDLRLFVEIATRRNLSHAAEQIGLSQPSASYAMQKLRRAFDDPLLVRVGREMHLTPVGESMLAFWSPVLDEAQSLAGGSFDPATSTRLFSIVGLIHEMSNSHGTFVDYLLRHAPNAGLIAQIMSVDDVDEALQDTVDLYVGPVRPAREGFKSESLGTFDVQLFYDAAVRRPPSTLSELSDREFLSISEHFQKLGKVDNMLIEHGYKPRRFRFWLSTFADVEKRIRGSDMLASGSKLLEWTALGKLDTAPVPADANPIEHAVRWSVRKDRDAGLIWLRRLVRSYFGNGPDTANGPAAQTRD